MSDNKLEIKNFHDISKLEKLRCNAYGMEYNGDNLYYKNKISDGNIVPLGCFYKQELVAGIYISNSLNSLFIEQIFVKREFQNSDLHIGNYLLHYVLKNKHIFEDYFGVKFSYSRLDNRGHESFYEKLGYVSENNLLDTMKKRI